MKHNVILSSVHCYVLHCVAYQDKRLARFDQLQASVGKKALGQQFDAKQQLLRSCH